MLGGVSITGCITSLYLCNTVDIHELITEGKTSVVCRELTLHSKRVNERNIAGETLLFTACMNNQRQIASLLIGLGCDLDAKDNGGMTCLVRVAMKNDTKLLSFLLLNGASMAIKDTNGMTALSWSTINDHKEAVEILLQNGLSANDKDYNGRTALNYAINNNNIEIATILINKGANVNTIDNYGDSLLHWTFALGYIQMAHLLIDNGANKNIKDAENSTPLERCSSEQMKSDFKEYFVSSPMNRLIIKRNSLGTSAASPSPFKSPQRRTSTSAI